MFGEGWFGDWLLNIAAWAAGFSQTQLALIERRLPNLRKLIDIINKLQPTINKIVPLVNEAMPDIEAALPLIQEAAKEVHVLAPALEIVLSVIERDLSAGKTRQDAISGIVNKLTHI